jgi:hypothetical protein
MSMLAEVQVGRIFRDGVEVAVGWDATREECACCIIC